ncbi:MAG: shikimate kinase [Magnetospirillum sp.]|nr:shikimate kinase [Magnetospirillum sp.]
MVQDMAEGIAPRLIRPIVLIGLMGAGKSCVGRRLAARLGIPFMDSDVEFETAAGCTISEFFGKFGEPAFREGERKVIARLMEGPPCVLATGGGAFCDPETRARIQEGAVSVWIRADLDLLVKRTSGRDHRPLLKQGDPREILSRLMDARYPLYAQADIIVDTTDEPPEVTVAKVADELASYLEHTP